VYRKSLLIASQHRTRATEGLCGKLSMALGSSRKGSTQAERDEMVRERSEYRRQQNLEIAGKVARGELSPLVVSFSPRIREGMRLPGRYCPES